MYVLLRLNLQLSRPAEHSVGRSVDSLAGLMGLALREKGLAQNGLVDSLNIWAEAKEQYGRQWLLCYEGSKRDWIQAPSGQNALQVDGPLRYLFEKDVSFLDLTRSPARPRRRTSLGAEDEGKRMAMNPGTRSKPSTVPRTDSETDAACYGATELGNHFSATIPPTWTMF